MVWPENAHLNSNVAIQNTRKCKLCHIHSKIFFLDFWNAFLKPF